MSQDYNPIQPRKLILTKHIRSPNCSYLLTPALKKYYLQRSKTLKSTHRIRWLPKTNWFQFRKGNLNQNIHSLWDSLVPRPWNINESRARQRCWLVDTRHINILNECRNWSFHWLRPNDNLPEHFKRKIPCPQRFR